MKLIFKPLIPFAHEYIEILNDEQTVIKESLLRGYDTRFAPLATPGDAHAIKQVQAVVASITSLQPTMLLLVGIGGSSMGSLAIIQALKGMLYNDTTKGISFYCADTIDNDFESDLLKRVEQELVKGGRVVLCLVTKSGMTTESLINGSLFFELLKKYRPDDYSKFLVVITDTDSRLAAIAHEKKYAVLEIPKRVGGRFSVFTAVGLFPLALLGIDIESFCKGAQELLEDSMTQKIENSLAAQSALTLFAHYQKGNTTHNIFVFSPDLYMMGSWYKQLIGESLGKKENLDGQTVEVGFMPVISVGTQDLHSVVQLYLANPINSITSFVHYDHEKDTVLVPHNKLSNLISGLAGRSVTTTKKAIFQGVLAAYESERRPFMVTTLQEKSAYNLGQFMMMKMLETIYIAKLWNINPFDQPAVELYKRYARQLMG